MFAIAILPTFILCPRKLCDCWLWTGCYQSVVQITFHCLSGLTARVNPPPECADECGYVKNTQGNIHAIVSPKHTDMLPCIRKTQQSCSSSRLFLARTRIIRLWCSPSPCLTLYSCANELYLSSHLSAAGCYWCNASWDIGWCSREGAMVPIAYFFRNDLLSLEKGIFHCC